MKIDEALKRLVEAGSDEEKVTLATLDMCVAGYPEDEQLDLRNAVIAAAVPHWFDRSIFEAILAITPEKAAQLVERVCSFSFVERHSARNAWNVHARYRGHFLAYLFREKPVDFRDIARRAQSYFSNNTEPYSRIECVYHALIALPKLGGQQLTRLSMDWKSNGTLDMLQSLANVIEESVENGRLEGYNLGCALYEIAQTNSSNRSSDRTLKMMGSALVEFEKLNELLDQGRVLDSCGRILVKIGQLDKALNALGRAQEIAYLMLRKYPNDQVCIGNLAVTSANLGFYYRNSGEHKKALTYYRRAVSALKKLSKKSPVDLFYRRSIPGSLSMIGNILLELGKTELAYESSLKALELFCGITSKQSGNIHVEHGYLTALMVHVRILFKMRRYEEALVILQDNIVQIRSLSERYPDDFDMQGTIASYCKSLEVVLKALGRSEEANVALEEYSSIALLLADKDPGNTHWVRRKMSLLRGELNELGGGDTPNRLD